MEDTIVFNMEGKVVQIFETDVFLKLFVSILGFRLWDPLTSSQKIKAAILQWNLLQNIWKHLPAIPTQETFPLQGRSRCLMFGYIPRKINQLYDWYYSF